MGFIQKLFETFLGPPGLPPLDLPFQAKLVPGIKDLFVAVLKAGYQKGVIDGAVVTFLVMCLFWPKRHPKPPEPPPA